MPTSIEQRPTSDIPLGTRWVRSGFQACLLRLDLQSGSCCPVHGSVQKLKPSFEKPLTKNR